MRLPAVRCLCGGVLSKSMGNDTGFFIKKLIIKDGNVLGVCKECNEEIALPLSVDVSKANPPIIIGNFKK
jgi:hypothetical protein